MMLKNKYTFPLLILLVSIIFWLVIINKVNNGSLTLSNLTSFKTIETGINEGNNNIDKSNIASKPITINDQLIFDSGSKIKTSILITEEDNSLKLVKKESAKEVNSSLSAKIAASKSIEVNTTSGDNNDQVQQIISNIQSLKKEPLLTDVRATESVVSLQDEIKNLKEKLKKTKKTNKEKNDALFLENINSDSKISQASSILKIEPTSKKPAVRSVKLREGESIWMLAERVYGDGKQYIKILKANPQFSTENEKRVQPGTYILIPQ